MKKNLKALLLLVIAFGLLLTGCGKTEETKTTYKITFDTDGGSEIETQTVEQGSLPQKPTDPTKEGYSFGGWEYNGSEYTFTNTVTSDITLKAKWEKAATRYTVRFDSDGGSTVYSITVNEGEPITKPSNPTKEGYTFKTWNLNGAEHNFSTPVTSNIELKAVWEVDTTISKPTENESHTVTFDSDGGSDVASQTVAHNKKATTPKSPTKSGYVFLDWTLNDKVYKFSTKVTADITLKATWTKEGNYTVTFDTNGSTDTIEKQTIKAGKLVTKPTDPKKDGYVLKEWQLNGKTYDFSTKVSQDMILKAVWTLPTFKVTFNTDGGSTVKAQTIEINKTAKKPTDPTKTGHTFKGWFVGEKEYDFATPVTADVTITAKWEATKYTVTFDSAEGSAVAAQEIEYGKLVTKPTNPTREGYTFKEWQLNGKTYNFSTKVTKAITLKATWTKEAAKTYTFKVKTIDAYSPDRTIEVYENGTKINFDSIKVGNSVICRGTNPTVNVYDVDGITSVTVVLTSGSSVTAKLSN